MAKHTHTHGTRLQDEGHHDHHLSSRRTFLRQLGLVTAGTALIPGAPLQALGSSKLAQALLDNPTERVLVLIRLKGGNDGLNTIVPLYDYGRYLTARPRIAYSQANLLSLTTELAVGNDFSAGHQLWQQGAMRVVNGVGYPDPNLSHFRSSDIITTASGAMEVLSSGWLGRHLDNCFPDYLVNPPSAPPAIQIGGAGSLTFTNEENVSLAVTVSSVEELVRLAEDGELYETANLPDCLYGEQLGYLRGVANSAFVFASGIETAYQQGTTGVQYPGGQLSRQLELVARLIKGGLETRLFMVTLDGFDTHAQQNQNHPALLDQLGRSVSAFYSDLQLSGDHNRVLATTFSEFGRRIEQNASNGTDHGTASPQLLFGPALNGNGAHGALPDLDNPDSGGNLNFTTDFRSIYATLLEQWLCIPAAEVDGVLGGNFNRLNLGFDCQSIFNHTPRASIEAVSLQRVGAAWHLAFRSRGGLYRLSLLDSTGRVVASEEHYVAAGAATLPLAAGNLPSGAYAYRLQGPANTTASGIVPLLR